MTTPFNPDRNSPILIMLLPLLLLVMTEILMERTLKRFSVAKGFCALKLGR